jgi:hypothetical protein
VYPFGALNGLGSMAAATPSEGTSLAPVNSGVGEEPPLRRGVAASRSESLEPESSVQCQLNSGLLE